MSETTTSTARNTNRQKVQLAKMLGETLDSDHRDALERVYRDDEYVAFEIDPGKAHSFGAWRCAADRIRRAPAIVLSPLAAAQPLFVAAVVGAATRDREAQDVNRPVWMFEQIGSGPRNGWKLVRVA